MGCIVDAQPQLQAVFTRLSRWIERKPQRLTGPWTMLQFPGCSLLQNWQTIHFDHAEPSLLLGFRQHKFKLRLVVPAGGHDQFKGFRAWPGLTGHKKGMPSMLLCALVPGAQRYAPLKHIPDRNSGCEAQGSKGHCFHRWGRDQWSRSGVLTKPAPQPGQLGPSSNGYNSVQFREIAAMTSATGQGGFKQLLQGPAETTLFQQILKITT